MPPASDLTVAHPSWDTSGGNRLVAAGLAAAGVLAYAPALLRATRATRFATASRRWRGGYGRGVQRGHLPADGIADELAHGASNAGPPELTPALERRVVAMAWDETRRETAQAV